MTRATMKDLPDSMRCFLDKATREAVRLQGEVIPFELIPHERDQAAKDMYILMRRWVRCNRRELNERMTNAMLYGTSHPEAFKCWDKS